MSKLFFTADQHFFHQNIIRYCDRPFDSVDQMHDVIIERHNSVVAPNDEVYFLGDVCMDVRRPKNLPCEARDVMQLLDRMNGRKHLIIGNHDPKPLIKLDLWQSVGHYKEIKRNGQKIVLMHYPIESWNGRAKGAIHLHGHSHGTLKSNDRYVDHHPAHGLRADVGVDCWDFYPVELDSVFKKLFKNGQIV